MTACKIVTAFDMKITAFRLVLNKLSACMFGSERLKARDKKKKLIIVIILSFLNMKLNCTSMTEGMFYQFLKSG